MTASGQNSNVRVELSTELEFTAPIRTIEVDSLSNYLFNDLFPATFFVRAYRDYNGNGECESNIELSTI